MQIYAAPLAGGARGVVLFNQQTTQSQYPMSNLTVFWEQIGLVPGQRALVRDLFSGGPSRGGRRGQEGAANSG